MNLCQKKETDILKENRSPFFEKKLIHQTNQVINNQTHIFCMSVQFNESFSCVCAI